MTRYPVILLENLFSARRFMAETLDEPRCSGEFDLPICRLKTGQRSFAFRGAKLYNNLPNKIKQISDVKKFKAKVYNYLLNL